MAAAAAAAELSNICIVNRILIEFDALNQSTVFSLFAQIAADCNNASAMSSFNVVIAACL